MNNEKCAWHPDRYGPYLALVPSLGGIIPTTCCGECASRLSRGEKPRLPSEAGEVRS